MNSFIEALLFLLLLASGAGNVYLFLQAQRLRQDLIDLEEKRKSDSRKAFGQGRADVARTIRRWKAKGG